MLGQAILFLVEND